MFSIAKISSRALCNAFVNASAPPVATVFTRFITVNSQRNSSLLPPSWAGNSLRGEDRRKYTLKTPAEKWSARSATQELRPPADAYTGRRVYVMNGDVGEAFARLKSRLRRNKVTYALKMQERHEKKGVKRRRLSSERWRKQFANEVRTTTVC
ncbi:hypothetical protein BJ138DRAFT_1109197 [Hygrophoropsis aurantiaca]|uniref:Uncharacterized protein n=1 Tax=Hygrophoropsis aurantiaca TaxID=72124 RepID=A0ACB8ATF6_9AGAM|nr:hypothetical protein BJ138DRAFT_1109197 [Hygrophoropsis aurantiaca]